LRAYVKQAGESLDMQNSCAEIKIRAERRIGEFSKKLPKQERKRTDLTDVQDDEQFKLRTLENAGIKNYQRYEAIADIPEDKFEEMGVVEMSEKFDYPTLNFPQWPYLSVLSLVL
jgi:hypothetical protein